MKKLILGLLSALALLPGGMLRSGDVRAAETFAVQSPRRDHRANPHANCHGERYEDRRGRYTKDSWSVYYRGRKVEGASVSSFADLGGGYGKDNWTVYYRGWKVEGASASSFADLGGGYGKDNWTVFYEGRKLEGASAMSFEYKGRGYGKDNWNTYFRGEQLRPRAVAGRDARRRLCERQLVGILSGAKGGRRFGFVVRISGRRLRQGPLEGGLSGTRSAGRIVVVV